MDKKEKINSLTPEQEALIEVYIKKFTVPIFNGDMYKNFNEKDAIEMVNWVYEYCGYALPKVIIADNPVQAQCMYNALKLNPALLETIKANPGAFNDVAGTLKKDFNIGALNDLSKIPSELKEVNEQYLFACDIYANVIIGFYSYLIEVLELTGEVVPLFNIWKEKYLKSGIYNGIFADEVCIISKYPHTIKRNEDNRLHCLTGPAVRFDGWDSYYINGRNIPESNFLRALNGELTKNDFLSETNEEIRAAYFEIIGQDRLLEMFAAEIIDECNHEHANGEVEHLVLYQTKEVIPGINEKIAWVRFICPSTKTNYLINVEPKWTSALEAAASTSPMGLTGEDYKFDFRA